ncbi:Rpn family recombination-promoting nuclease/putative transposase [Paenibacillus amylolyticus]|nr:Rpn family recombination-promoting nuclease/putative transposase [Paenibacillus amylolyticus]
MFGSENNKDVLLTFLNRVLTTHLQRSFKQVRMPSSHDFPGGFAPRILSKSSN